MVALTLPLSTDTRVYIDTGEWPEDNLPSHPKEIRNTPSRFIVATTTRLSSGCVAPLPDRVDTDFGQSGKWL